MPETQIEARERVLASVAASFGLRVVPKRDRYDIVVHDTGAYVTAISESVGIGMGGEPGPNGGETEAQYTARVTRAITESSWYREQV